MTQDLKDELVAAYAHERFTLTAAEIEARAAGRRWSLARPAIAVAGVAAMATVGVVLTGPGQAPQVAMSPPVPSASADLSRLNQKCKDSAPSKNDVKLPVGEPLAAAESAGEPLLVYGDDRMIYACYGMGATILNPLGDPVDPTARVPEFAASVARPGPLLVVGWVPNGVTAVEAVLPDGRAFKATTVDGIFFIWQVPAGAVPENMARHIIVRFTAPEQITLRQVAAGTGAGACESALNGLPLPGTKSSAPPLRFTGGAAELLLGDSEVLVHCRPMPSGSSDLMVVEVSYRPPGRPAGPFEQLHHVGLEHGYVFGRAPLGAIAGEVTIRSGKTVPLSINDGFYSAFWGAENEADAPVRVRIDTATERWVYEGGKTTRAAK